MLFSVISPFYKVEQFARECIESVLRQTEHDFEFILVDDGSPDAVPQILDEYAKKDSRIRVIHKENGGVVSARKAGAEAAQGDYVVILDGDDWIDERYLEALKVAGCQNGVDMVYTGYCTENENGERAERHIKTIGGHYGMLDQEELRAHVRTNPFQVRQHLWAKAIKRYIYVGYQMAVDDIISNGDDEMVIYPLLCNINSMFLLDQCLYHYRIQSSSITHSSKSMPPFESVILKLNHLNDMLPSEVINKEGILSGYACRHFMGNAMAFFRNLPYSKAKAETRKYLQHGSVICGYLKPKPVCKSFFDKLSYVVLKLRRYAMIKLFSILK